jgi:hypothetical protein
MSSLHDMHKMNTFTAGCVCLVHMFQLKNCWVNFDEIWYGMDTQTYMVLPT